MESNQNVPPQSPEPLQLPPVRAPNRRPKSILIAVLMVGLVLGAASTLILTGPSSYSQLRTLFTRLAGRTTNQPIQSGNLTSCWAVSSTDGLVLNAVISTGSQNASATMLVDTGAYISAAPVQLAYRLGINPYSGTPVNLGSVYGQREVGYVHTLSLILPNLKKVQIPIAIMLSSNIPYVLGREGFLDQFRLQVAQDSGSFCLQQV